MIKEADDTIKSLEEAEKFQADLMSKQQAFNFDGKVN
jgi:hypothetical protein